jgi:hypothetical protein
MPSTKKPTKAAAKKKAPGKKLAPKKAEATKSAAPRKPRPKRAAAIATTVDEVYRLADVLKWATPFASDDQARPVLNALHFIVKPDKLVVEATDSYVLVRITTSCDADGEADFMVGLKDVDALLGLARKFTSPVIDIGLGVPAATQFGVQDKGRRTVLTPNNVLGTYPNVDRLISADYIKPGAIDHVHLAPHVLERVVSLGKRIGCNAIRFGLGETPLAPVSFTVDVGAIVRVEGVAMPIRTAEEKDAVWVPAQPVVADPDRSAA